MGVRAGEAWRVSRAPVRNPFRHPALQAFATLWRQGFLTAVSGQRPQSG